MALLRTLEEDLKALGLVDASTVVETVEVETEVETDTDPDPGTAEFEALSIEEQFRVKMKKKFRKHRPKVRLKAAQKAKMRMASRKRRRSGAGRKLARLRGKAMKKARSRGMKAGRISISVASKDLQGNMVENKISALVESMLSIATALSLKDEQNELRKGFESVIEIADMACMRLEGIKDDLPKSLRDDVEEFKLALSEMAEEASYALNIVLEGKEKFDSSSGKEVSFADVLEDLVAELKDYVDALPAFEQET